MGCRRGWMSSLGVLAALAGVPGCCDDGPRVSGPAPPALVEGTLDPDGPFPPEQVRIHALTGMVSDDDGRVRVELHFELIDQHGHRVKALGELVAELYLDAGLGRGAGPQLLERWVLDLSQSGVNAAAYDRVTRTYRVALTGVPDSVQTDRTAVIAVGYTTAGGRSLSSTFRFGR